MYLIVTGMLFAIMKSRDDLFFCIVFITVLLKLKRCRSMKILLFKTKFVKTKMYKILYSVLNIANKQKKN